MPLSGLVLTLDNDPGKRASAAAFLNSDPRVTLGKLAGRWLSIATDTGSENECRELHDLISGLPGVVYVDVVAVSFPEADLAEEETIHPLAC